MNATKGNGKCKICSDCGSYFDEFGELPETITKCIYCDTARQKPQKTLPEVMAKVVANAKAQNKTVAQYLRDEE
jgi:hypothetical protein